MSLQTFDTADIYSHGHSELILGKALKQMGAPRESVVILTKVFFPTTGPSDVSIDYQSEGNSLK
jgi:aryl-alcohol dehydrogenase-like predicted oxidoreductase